MYYPNQPKKNNDLRNIFIVKDMCVGCNVRHGNAAGRATVSGHFKNVLTRMYIVNSIFTEKDCGDYRIVP